MLSLVRCFRTEVSERTFGLSFSSLTPKQSPFHCLLLSVLFLDPTWFPRLSHVPGANFWKSSGLPATPPFRHLSSVSRLSTLPPLVTIPLQPFFSAFTASIHFVLQVYSFSLSLHRHTGLLPLFPPSWRLFCVLVGSWVQDPLPFLDGSGSTQGFLVDLFPFYLGFGPSDRILLIRE